MKKRGKHSSKLTKNQLRHENGQVFNNTFDKNDSMAVITPSKNNTGTTKVGSLIQTFAILNTNDNPETIAKAIAGTVWMHIDKYLNKS